MVVVEPPGGLWSQFLVRAAASVTVVATSPLASGIRSGATMKASNSAVCTVDRRTSLRARLRTVVDHLVVDRAQVCQCVGVRWAPGPWTRRADAPRERADQRSQLGRAPYVVDPSGRERLSVSDDARAHRVLDIEGAVHPTVAHPSGLGTFRSAGLVRCVVEHLENAAARRHFLASEPTGSSSSQIVKRGVDARECSSEPGPMSNPGSTLVPGLVVPRARAGVEVAPRPSTRATHHESGRPARPNVIVFKQVLE